jgi:hypothetical protein
MEEYKIHPPAAACAGCGRAFGAGDEILSTLREEAERFVRIDTCGACRPEGEAFCFFRTRAPRRDPPAKTVVEEVREFFKKLAASPEPDARRRRLKYLTALWLTRKKQLKLTATARHEGRTRLTLQQAWDAGTIELEEESIPDADLEPLLNELGTLFHLNPQEAKIELQRSADGV